MKRVMKFGAMLACASASSAHAANFAAIVTPPGFLSIVVAAICVVSAMGCWKVFELVKGGYLSKSWLMFTSACGVFALSQVLHFLSVLELFSLPSFVVPLMLAVVSGLILFGVIETKKTLS